MQKQNFSQGGFMPKNRQHNRKTKYPDKVTKPKRLVLVRIFLFCSVGIKIQYFPTAPFINRLLISGPIIADMAIFMASPIKNGTTHNKSAAIKPLPC